MSEVATSPTTTAQGAEGTTTVASPTPAPTNIAAPQGGQQQVTSLTSTPEPGPQAQPEPATAGGEAPASPATPAPTGDEATAVEPFTWNESTYSALGFQPYEDDYWAIREEDPDLGVIAYRTLDDWRKGTREKQRHIVRLDGQLATISTELDSERNARLAAERQAAALRNFVDTNQVEMMRAREIMVKSNPEFEKITDRAQLTSDEDRIKYDNAMVEARASVKAEVAAAEAQQRQYEEAVSAHMKKAETFYNDRLDRAEASKRFNLRNTEELGALQRFLSQPSGRQMNGQDLNLAEEVYHIYLQAGERAADIYLDGLRTQFWSEYRGSDPVVRPPAPPAPAPAPAPAAPQTVVVNENKPPVAPAPAQSAPFPNAMSQLRAGSSAARQAISRQGA